LKSLDYDSDEQPAISSDSKMYPDGRKPACRGTT
jgi:hypothetical protein